MRLIKKDMSSYHRCYDRFLSTYLIEVYKSKGSLSSKMQQKSMKDHIKKHFLEFLSLEEVCSFIVDYLQVCYLRTNNGLSVGLQ